MRFRNSSALAAYAVTAIFAAGCGATAQGTLPTKVTHVPAVPPSAPSALAFDSRDNLFVADFFANVVYKINPSGNIAVFAGTGVQGHTGSGGPTARAEISNPDGLAIAPNGTVFIDEHSVNRIREVDTSGVIKPFAGAGSMVLNGCSFGGDGGPATKADLATPTTLAIDMAGNVYVTDRNNNRVRRINRSGIITTIAGNGKAGFSGDGGRAAAAELNGPDGIAIDTRGDLFVCDDANHRIRKIDVHGIITTVAGNGGAQTSGDGGPATKAGITDPSGVAVGPTGDLYFTDFTANRIRKIDRHGIITTIAGAHSPSGGGNKGDGGPASRAQLHNPRGIVVDPLGDVYFSDQGNHSVRRINRSETISTLFGA
jgi:hypothetical protein